eukprot:00601.XXX_2805_2978_1 [CDS] Oithona nana genome sequencing.
MRKSYEVPKDLLQCSQSKDNPSCFVLMWLSKSLFHLYFFGHCSQSYEDNTSCFLWIC